MDFIELWPGGPEFCDAGHFGLSTDSVLLSDFINIGGAGRGIDLGAGAGIISLLLLCRSARLHMTGLEILPDAAEVFESNMARNGLSSRSNIRRGDIRSHRELFRSGEFDLAAANPPYFPVERGALSPVSGRDAARGESLCTLHDLCAAAAFLLHTGGRFCLVHKPERLSEIFCAMTAVGIEPKRLRLCFHRADTRPSLVLIEGKRGGKPGLIIENPLILHKADGSDTAEMRRIYHLT